MRRYATRSAFLLVDEWGDASMTADQIIVEDEEHKPTGLLDANGDKLYRVRDRVKFGFVKEQGHG